MRNIFAGLAIVVLLAAGLSGTAATNAPVPHSGSVPVTETNVDSATGAINVHEKGVVRTLPGRLANPIYPFVSPIPNVAGTGNGPTRVSGPDPALTRYAISSLTFTNLSLTDFAQATVFDSDCSQTGGAIIADVAVPASHTVHLDFPQPVLSPSLVVNTMCLWVTARAANAADTLEMTIVGDVTS